MIGRLIGISSWSHRINMLAEMRGVTVCFLPLGQMECMYLPHPPFNTFDSHTAVIREFFQFDYGTDD